MPVKASRIEGSKLTIKTTAPAVVFVFPGKSDRCKINVTKEHQVPARVEGQDSSTDPATAVFMQHLLKSIRELSGNPHIQFPENVDAVNFDVYSKGSDNSMELKNNAQPLTKSQPPTR